jgi:hypothetical protein
MGRGGGLPHGLRDGLKSVGRPAVWCDSGAVPATLARAG